MIELRKLHNVLVSTYAIHSSDACFLRPKVTPSPEGCSHIFTNIFYYMSFCCTRRFYFRDMQFPLSVCVSRTNLYENIIEMFHACLLVTNCDPTKTSYQPKYITIFSVTIQIYINFHKRDILCSVQCESSSHF